MINHRKITHKSILAVILMLALGGLSALYGIPSRLPNDVGRTASYQSSELMSVSTIEDNKEIISFIDSEGNITYASDKHYASVTKSKDDSGNITTEVYLDENGEPTLQPDGYYALKRTYNDKGQNIETTYLDAQLNPCRNTWNYATIRRTFNAEGKKEKETFYDENGKRVRHLSDEYGRRFEYDNETECTTITYLGIDDKPTRKKIGYAKVARTYWENGKIKTDLYYDVDGQPIKLSLGQYGIYREYDDFGREKQITYLDATGQPMMTSQGYATVKYMYSNGIVAELYYDQAGQPVQLSRGQYGTKKTGNQAVYLNEKGEEQFELGNYLRNHPWWLIIIAFAAIALSTILNKKSNIYLGSAGILFLIYITLLYRSTEGTGANLELLWSYKQFFTKDTLRIEILNNIWLFIPLGCILFNIIHSPKALIILVMISIFIELTQLILGAGLCELDDVLSNGIGGVIGYCVGYIINSIKEEKRKIQ